MDRFDLQRFVDAQAENYGEAIAELRAGEKRTHWSWYVLPQVKGLGMSSMSVRYAISGIEEARAYLGHPALGPRIRETFTAINSHENLSAVDILGPVDAQKLHSCATLFASVSPEGSLFHTALARFFANTPDRNTLAILKKQAEPGV